MSPKDRERTPGPAECQRFPYMGGSAVRHGRECRPGLLRQNEHFVASFDWNTVTDVASNISFNATGPIASSLFHFTGTFFDSI